jgi:hypothetical protein
VQGLPSLHDPVPFTCTQPDPGEHESSVHGLPSSQDRGPPPTHDPPEQTSFVVQALPSVHGAVLFAWMQPTAGEQESSVHGLASAHAGGGPPTQAPFAHASFVVQALPSVQEAVLFVCTQPVPGAHESFVHGLPSLHAGGGPPTHDPPEQASFVVQALPSSQEPLAGGPA